MAVVERLTGPEVEQHSEPAAEQVELPRLVVDAHCFIQAERVLLSLLYIVVI